MQGPLLKQNRQDRLINKLYILHDAMHHIDISNELASEAREMICNYLQKEIQILRIELTSPLKDAGDEFDEIEMTSVFGDFICDPT